MTLQPTEMVTGQLTVRNAKLYEIILSVAREMLVVEPGIFENIREVTGDQTLSSTRLVGSYTQMLSQSPKTEVFISRLMTAIAVRCDGMFDRMFKSMLDDIIAASGTATAPTTIQALGHITQGVADHLRARPWVIVMYFVSMYAAPLPKKKG